MAKVPEYPRPVSPLQYEPIKPSPRDVYLDETSSSSDEEQRQAKRRRVEQIGQQYLRGYPIFISTASLRGPFKEGWENPWAKNRKAKTSKRKQELQATSKEIPETVRKTETRQNLSSVKNQNEIPNAQLEAAACDTGTRTAEIEYSKRPSTPKTLVTLAEHDPFKTTSAQKSKTKVEDWLRKDNGVLRPRNVADYEPPQSPTARFTAVNASKPEVNTRQEPQTPQAQASTGDQKATKVAIVVEPFSTLIAKGTQAQNQIHENDRDKTFKIADGPSKANIKSTADRGSAYASLRSTSLPNDEREPLKQAQKNRDSVESENWVHDAKAERKHTSDPGPSASLNDSHGRTPDPQTKRYQDRTKHNTRIAKKNDSVALVSPPQINVLDRPKKPPSPARDVVAVKTGIPNLSETEDTRKMPPPPPSLTTETSSKTETTMTSHLPSAQVVPQPQNPIFIPSLPSTNLDPREKISVEGPGGDDDRVEDSIIFLSTQAAVARAQERLQDAVDTSDGQEDIIARADEKHGTRPSGSAHESVTPLEATLAKEKVPTPTTNTQAMMNAAKATKSSASKTKSANLLKAGPAGSLKPRSEKPTKKASFAPDTQNSSASSESSLKSLMKVKKGKAAEGSESKREEHTLDTPNLEDETPHYQSPGPDMDTSIEEGASAEKVSDNLHKTGPAPMASTLPSVPSAGTTHPPSGQQLDGQQRMPMGNIISFSEEPNADSQGFDLDAAMADVGSFLAAWDPEKESRGLAS
ncbi:MAG: hypothetical protein Q9227_002242 [Pyrenula ochraceoflavens]